ncbi:hypothetical protein LTR05_008257 [Lithohypha guttulata]|uniref:WLM domain-containing protein n=1 Tax=Lithohypha guttulata TaxID=1690604 RepID=A0AAN7STH1_9EURO|nr:hypothetical protein LTR05_008257 [Lithohypha guttulata]
MPLNTLRLNHQPSSHPNDRIVFIKPIKRPAPQKDDYDRAELVLKAIAAQCLPIMKSHHLSVTTLEEYEPNPEFIGRNFNNGEIIQLVIQSKSGAWLPLNMIQMVMMHELAHNTHMNHGKGFWAARNLYATEMKQLWNKGYTGEGLWGQGRTLGDIESAIGGRILRTEELGGLPLCGGTFRSRRKKRKAKADGGQELTWKEKKEKRIEKKFGKNGSALGEDEDKRLSLQINSKIKGSLGTKSRVAQSKRGRELRAAAALARFSTNKQEVTQLEAEQDSTKHEDSAAETESEYEEVDMDAGQEDAKDQNGKMILDGKGLGMIKVCDDETGDNTDLRNEMEELANITAPLDEKTTNTSSTLKVQKSTRPSNKRQHVEFSTFVDSGKPVPKATKEHVSHLASHEAASSPLTLSQSSVPLTEERLKALEPQQTDDNSSRRPSLTSYPSTVALPDIVCSICSTPNEPHRSTCEVCAHVIVKSRDPRAWRCKSDDCKDSGYLNAGDCGLCGVCGIRKPPPAKTVHFRESVSFADSPQYRSFAGNGSGSDSGHIAHL